MSVTVKLYSSGDESGIVDLFSLVFKQKMSKDYWNWRYRENIVNQIYINLAYDGQVLAAHYALSPSYVIVDGERKIGALSMTTMTHPEYRGQRLFTRLASDLFQKTEKNIDIIYGVPNANSLKGFTKYLGFNTLEKINVFEIKTKDITFLEKGTCEEIVYFSEEINDLLISTKGRYRVMVERDASYLNWRYVLNPENDYRKFVLKEGGEIRGYVITKIFENDGERTGDIVDVIAKDNNSYRSLIKYACAQLTKENVVKIQTWMSDEAFVGILFELGFYEAIRTFDFIIRRNNGSISETVLNYDNWYLTMGDIDIF